MWAQHFCLVSVYIFEWKLNITKYKVFFIVDMKKKNPEKTSIAFDFCNILHANFYQLPDGRISISSLGRPNCVLHAPVPVSVLAITNWRVALSKICHSWSNNVVTHSCVCAHSWVIALFGHSWHIFDNETHQLVIV